jgi:hypothetical protein
LHKSNSLIHVAAFVEADDCAAIHITPVVLTSLNWYMLIKYHLLPAKYLGLHKESVSEVPSYTFLEFIADDLLSSTEHFASVFKSAYFQIIL